MAWIIFFAGIIWAAIYDTMYAMVDRDDDLKIGVKSSAIVFGDMDKLIIGMLQALMLFALYLVGTNMEYGYWYNTGAGRRAACSSPSSSGASASASRSPASTPSSTTTTSGCRSSSASCSSTRFRLPYHEGKRRPEGPASVKSRYHHV